MGKQNVLLESQNQNFEKLVLSQQLRHQELSDKIDHMQVFFSSQFSYLITLIKAADAKKVEKPKSSCIGARYIHLNPYPVNYL